MKANIIARWFFILCGAALVCLLTGCGDGTTCGQGTYEDGDECKGVVAGQVVRCGPGLVIKGDKCVPGPELNKSACGANTTYDAKTNTCIGTGTGPSDPCSDVKFQCQPASGSSICISGKVVTVDSLLDPNKKLEAVPLLKNKLKIEIYDPQTLLIGTNPKPLTAVSTFDDNGCYIIPKIVIPFLKSFIIAVDDSGTTDNYQLAGHGVLANSGQNLVDLKTPAFQKSVVDAWSKELGGSTLDKTGALIVTYQTTAGRLEGMGTFLDGKEPKDWSAGTIHFFSDIPSTSPYFDTKVTSTNKSGSVLVKEAPIGPYSGKKGTDCEYPSVLQGSKPGWIIYGLAEVTDPDCLK